jgi:hypothetical protein
MNSKSPRKIWVQWKVSLELIFLNLLIVLIFNIIEWNGLEIFYVLGITTNLSTTRTVVGQMPTSCADLERNGQKVNGFFLVKGSKKMETVYCNFYPNQTGMKCWSFLFIDSLIKLVEIFCLQPSKNGLDTPTSSRRPSISTSREILHLTQKTLRFRSIWCGWTREMPWIW